MAPNGAMVGVVPDVQRPALPRVPTAAQAAPEGLENEFDALREMLERLEDRLARLEALMNELRRGVGPPPPRP